MESNEIVRRGDGRAPTEIGMGMAVVRLGAIGRKVNPPGDQRTTGRAAAGVTSHPSSVARLLEATHAATATLVDRLRVTGVGKSRQLWRLNARNWVP
ncbi:MAG: hypothetical protein KDD44_02555 [Bdellovibrionales bacterium]|nr:hypothetical protein [Bdellovibrionales bacterium]